MKKLNVKVNPQMYKEFKAKIALEDLTISEWVRMKIEEFINS